MHKFLILTALVLSPYLVSAQSTVGTIDFDLNEMYGPEDKIYTFAQYTPPEEGNEPIETTEWCILKLDDEGNPGTIVYREELHGEPAEYAFPPPSAMELKEGYRYQVMVTATDVTGRKKAVGVDEFYFVQYTLTADDEFCCNGAIIGNGSYMGPPNISHQWVLTECDAQGNINPPAYWDSGVHPGAPGQYIFPSVIGQPLLCDQYYRIDLYFYDPANPSFPTIKSKVVKTTKVKLKTKKGYCCGQYINASAEFCGPETATHHTYTLTPADQNGNILGPDVYNSGNLGGAPTNLWLDYWNYPGITCGNYYLFTVTVYSGATPVGTNTHLIYMSPIPQPIITGPTNVCGTGSFCATNITGTGNIYQWVQYINWPASIPGAGNTSCVTVPYASTFAGVGVYVTNQYGCTNPGAAGFPVTNTYNDPSFYVQTASTGFYTYTASAYRSVALHSGATDSWKLVEIDGNNNNLMNTALTNLQWANYSPITFFGYDHNLNNSYNDNTYNVYTPTPAILNKVENYRVIRTVTAPGCPAAVDTWAFNQYGMFAKNMSTNTSSAEQEIIFLAYPNPTNGMLTISTTSEEPGVIDVFTMLGSKVKTMILSGGTSNYMLDLSENSTGIYLVSITVGNKTETKRIIKE
jgi:hypothetical protein